MVNNEELNARTKKRDPYFDNARFLLVALVVLGHIISPARQEVNAVFFANNYLTSFRMPALILITGFFSKRFYKGHDRFVKKITLGVLVPYMIFQSLYSLLNDYIYAHDQYMIELLSPSLAMWFLLSLFFWNMMLFLFTKLKHPIILSFLLGIGIGCFDNAGHYLSISRTFVFYPFFLIGHYLSQEDFKLFKLKMSKLFSIFAIILSWLLLSFFSLLEMRKYLLAKYPYAEVADSYLEGAAVRILFYLVMFLGILAFLPWVPKRDMFFTHLGKRTAYIYILHILVLKLFSAAEKLYGLEVTFQMEPWLFAAVPAIWVAVIYLVSSNPVTKLTKPLIEGHIASPLFAKESKTSQNTR